MWVFLQIEQLKCASATLALNGCWSCSNGKFLLISRSANCVKDTGECRSKSFQNVLPMKLFVIFSLWNVIFIAVCGIPRSSLPARFTYRNASHCPIVSGNMSDNRISKTQFYSTGLVFIWVEISKTYLRKTNSIFFFFNFGFETLSDK